MKATMRERFADYVMPEPNSGCHLWTGYIAGTGYGRLHGGGRGNTKYAHRAAWEQVHGAIPPGLFVMHRCDTPACVNPDHLSLGTHTDNMKDMLRKGRYVGNRMGVRTECKNGHALTDENTHRSARRPGTRLCKQCWRAANARQIIKRRAKRLSIQQEQAA